MYQTLLILSLLFYISVSPIEAHPGGTDGSGGHRCRTNCEEWGLGSGEYHHHNPDGSVKRVESAPVATTAPVKQFAPINTTAPSRIPTRAVTNTPTPTAEPTDEPTNTPSPKEPTPTIAVQGASEDSGGGGVVAMALLGGLGYLGYRRFKKKKVTV